MKDKSERRCHKKSNSVCVDISYELLRSLNELNSHLDLQIIEQEKAKEILCSNRNRDREKKKSEGIENDSNKNYNEVSKSSSTMNETIKEEVREVKNEIKEKDLKNLKMKVIKRKNTTADKEATIFKSENSILKEFSKAQIDVLQKLSSKKKVHLVNAEITPRFKGAKLSNETNTSKTFARDRDKKDKQHKNKYPMSPKEDENSAKIQTKDKKDIEKIQSSLKIKKALDIASSKRVSVTNNNKRKLSEVSSLIGDSSNSNRCKVSLLAECKPPTTVNTAKKEELNHNKLDISFKNSSIFKTVLSEVPEEVCNQLPTHQTPANVNQQLKTRNIIGSTRLSHFTEFQNGIPKVKRNSDQIKIMKPITKNTSDTYCNFISEFDKLDKLTDEINFSIDVAFTELKFGEELKQPSQQLQKSTNSNLKENSRTRNSSIVPIVYI